MRKLTVVTIFLLLLIGLIIPTAAAQSNEVVVMEIKGAVTPTMVSYFERGVAEAERREAEAVLIVLDTPGGLVDSTLEIVRLFRNSDVPIIVYIGPAGAQAASAGSIITMAAHAAGMAPETVIGAAAVIGSEGQELGETAQRKATEDLQAVVRTLTARRGEEVVALAESMIDEARAVNSVEALDVGLIDVIAPGWEALLVELDGHEVTIQDETVTLETAAADVVRLEMTAVETVLYLLSNPFVLGLLLAIAVPAILIELNSPGGWVAGFIGVTCLVLALYGVGQLPANWLGLGLVAIAFVLLLLEVKTGTGALALVGTITLLAGLLVMFNSPGSPEFARISIPGAVVITLTSASFFLFVATMALRAQQRPAATGKEGLVGKVAEVKTPLGPTGSVLVHGEIWRARAKREVARGEKVVVKSLDGFTLHVEPIDELIDES